MKRALVIGLGASGLFASKLLAEKGWKVTAVGRGTPMTALSTGCLKGHVPNGDCLKDITRSFRASGMPLVGGENDRVGVSNLGTRYDCSLSPAHSTWSEDDVPRSITVLGMGDHPSLRSGLATAVISTWGPKADAQIFPLSVPTESLLSAAFQDPERWDALVRAMKETRGDTVLLPPLCSLSDYDRYDDLERRSGRKVLEAITPLSTPGRRFLDVLMSGAVQAGAELWSGRKVIELEARAEEITAATVQGGLDTRSLELDAVLLATGGPLSDGLLLHPTGLSDPFARFKVVSDQDALHGGYAHFNERLRSSTGEEIANAFGAGDCLTSPQRKCGQGLAQALESAWKAVQAMEVL